MNIRLIQGLKAGSIPCFNTHFSDMITHLEPDILEFEIKWSLGSISTSKASGDYGIPVELFHVLKDLRRERTRGWKRSSKTAVGRGQGTR